jgi:cytochrome d ubiquinol oxidase subunit II
LISLLLLLVATYTYTDFINRLGVNPGAIPITGIVAALLAGYFIRKLHMGWAFGMTVITIAASLVTFFLMLYPDLMISTIDPAYSLTIFNASSSPYTLRIMTFVAIILVPLVLLYQGWTYWVFRKRIKAEPETLTY